MPTMLEASGTTQTVTRHSSAGNRNGQLKESRRDGTSSLLREAARR